MRTSRLHRVLRIMMAVQSGSATSAEAIAKRVGASRRTIYRDMLTLSAAGYSIFYDRTAGRYVAELAMGNQTQDLSLREAVTIIRMCRLAGQSTIPGLGELVNNTIEKILAIVPMHLRIKAENILGGTMARSTVVAVTETTLAKTT